jgi:putative zinc finger protein
MRCTEARPLFPLYLDSAVTGNEMHALSGHISECAECRSEYNKLENTRLLVSSLGSRPAPPDLALKIRVKLSHERSRQLSSILKSYAVRLEDAFNAFMFPATAGVVTAILCFGILVQFFVPIRAQAASDDEVSPGIFMPARADSVQSAIYYNATNGDMDYDLIIVQAQVGTSGKVENYQILSGPNSAEVRTQLNRALLFMNFTPAYAFGQPVTGTAVLGFSAVKVSSRNQTT